MSTFDAASNSGYQATASTYNWNHTCTGSNRYLVVGVSMLSVIGSSVTSITIQGTTVKALVIAGGGGGGKGASGGAPAAGGGAGGYQYNASVTVTEQAYTVTVGNGGATQTTSNTPGNDGQNSVFSTITGTGGGGGAVASAPNGRNGGSGGGATYDSGTGGTGSQGNNGGNGPTSSGSSSAGGGGGASAVGGNASAAEGTTGGAGGAGTANSITGASVTYAGGGGGGSYNGTGASGGGAGGAGGGGDGGDGDVAAGTAGTDNLGGGGGGGGGTGGGNGGAGGKGVVIISYVTASFGTCTGGTITTDGANTVHTFNASGTFTVVGKPFTFLGAVSSAAGAIRAELWGLIAPATGSNSIAVTLSTGLISAATAISFTGVHQTSPTEGLATATATNVGAADATVNVTTVATNDCVVDQVATDDTAITVGAGQTSRNNVTGAGGSGADSTEQATTPATVTMSWTNVAALATWSTVAIALRDTSASTLSTGRTSRISLLGVA